MGLLEHGPAVLPGSGLVPRPTSSLWSSVGGAAGVEGALVTEYVRRSYSSVLPEPEPHLALRTRAHTHTQHKAIVLVLELKSSELWFLFLSSFGHVQENSICLLRLLCRLSQNARKVSGGRGPSPLNASGCHCLQKGTMIPSLQDPGHERR